MFIRVKEKPNGKKSIQIVQTEQTPNGPRQKILRHVGLAANEREVAEMKRLATKIKIDLECQENPVLPGLDRYEGHAAVSQADLEVHVQDLKETARVNDGFVEVFGKIYDDLKFNALLDNGGSIDEVLKACVLARVFEPSSKLATSQLLKEQFGAEISEDRIYRMMDKVAKEVDGIKDSIRDTTLAILDQTVEVAFFDVTTLYFESFSKDELRNFGFSKDCKFAQTQVVLALITTTQGLPLGYELFPGNTSEASTLIPVIKQIKEKFDVTNLCLVADRGMFNQDNLNQLQSLGVTFVVAAKLKALPLTLRSKILAAGDSFRPAVVNRDFCWIADFPKFRDDRRFIVTYSSKRAKKDESDRQKLLERLLKKASKDKNITVKKLITNAGTKKFISTPANANSTIDDKKVLRDAEMDGLHGIATNDEAASAHSLLEKYRGLWTIEDAFRVNKHNLQMRPVFHWKPERIKAHIAICFIAYSLLKIAHYKINQTTKLSIEEIRHQLRLAQSSVVVDLATGNTFLLPSNQTSQQASIYEAMGLKREQRPKLIKK